MHDDDTLDPAVASIAALARHPATLDEAVRARVMLAVQTEMLSGRPARERGRFGWALQPRPIRLSPVGALALAAGLVGIGVAVGVIGRARTFLLPDAPPAAVAGATPFEGATPAALPVVPTGSASAQVKFVFVAPQASQVTLVGNFNGWNPSAHPMQRTPTGGTWTVTVPLEAGRHEYSFVIDGSQWMPDPSAPLAAADGFGAANSVLLVSGSTS